jgi:seryl-tRNA synthetase
LLATCRLLQKVREARTRRSLLEQAEAEEKLQKARRKQEQEDNKVQKQLELEQKRVEREKLKKEREKEKEKKAQEVAQRKQQKVEGNCATIPNNPSYNLKETGTQKEACGEVHWWCKWGEW